MSLYHYTDINAIVSIIEKNELWLTHTSFLNDKHEIVEGINKFIDAINKHDSYKGMNENIAGLLNSFLDYEIVQMTSQDVFLTSFCDEVDSLNQWRSYGFYAIEFSKDVLKNYFGDELQQCIYEDVEKKQLCDKILNQELLNIKSHFDESISSVGIDSIGSIYTMVKNSTRFKHACFKEEKEHRIFKKIDENRIYFRPKNDVIIPYIKVELPKRAIKCIHIGPIENQNLSFQALYLFLMQEIKKNEDLNDILIKKSNIPYRGKI